MFTDKAAAIVAVVFAAVILAHPGPAIAQADVDKAMGVLPSPPGASKGIVIVDGKQMSYEDAKKMGVDPSGAESKGIIIVSGKPMSLGDAAAKGIIIVGIKPGGLPSPGAEKGNNFEEIKGEAKPAEFKPGAQTAAPGAKVGQAPDDGLPGTSAIDIDKALLGESLDLGAGLPTLPTATQGGVALRGGNVMQQLGDDGQRPGGIAAKGASPPGGLGGAARKGIFPSENKPGSLGMLPAAKGPPTVLPAGKGPPTVLPAAKGIVIGKMPPSILPAGKGMMIKGK